MNPELRRNLWLELSPHRWLAMPAVLFLFFLLAYLVGRPAPAGLIAGYAAAAFIVIAAVWGAKLAHEGMLREVDAHTWDDQRLSLIEPWSMTWGKLFGSTLFAWYGGLLSLGVFVAAHLVSGGGLRSLKLAALMLFTAVAMQGLGLLGALLTMHRGAPGGRRYGGLFVLGLLGLFWLGGLLAPLDIAGQTRWYGRTFGSLDFALASVGAWSAWCVVGVYRILRAELQCVNGPWVWLLFVLFCDAWFAGFVPAEAGAGRPLFAFGVSVLLAYFMLLGEAKESVALRRLLRYAAAGQLRRVAQELPRWFLTAVVALLLALWLTLRLPLPDLFGQRLVSAWFPFIVLAFLARDAGLFLWLNLGRRPRWADAAALVYLAVLYGLLPALLQLLHLAPLRPLLLPPLAGGATALLWPLLEAAPLLLLAARRLRSLVAA